MKSEQKSTILIVDDETTNIVMLSDLLKDEYQIKIAKSGQKAIDIAKSEGIDLILLDIEMPQLSGYEVCKTLKDNQKTKSIPIIFVTAKADEADEEKGLNLGAIDYITKPFSKAIVKLRIKNHIQLKYKTDLLEQYSLHDGLTNIKNRRFFDDAFDVMYREVRRDKTNLTLMMIDIDFFKLYNDHYGHGKGDETLIKVANAIQSALLRPTDFVARYGGEEFIVLLKAINQEGVITVCNNILKAVRDLNILHEYSQAASYVSISIGATQYDANLDISKDKILKRADEALYEVKKKGRDNLLMMSLS
ncbi:MAG: diguanylate cyclase [Leptonema sp. (in: Bacteria)]|nr:diguanylate cyclase [Leptonema sp. (in: bacteria)]